MILAYIVTATLFMGRGLIPPAIIEATEAIPVRFVQLTDSIGTTLVGIIGDRLKTQSLVVDPDGDEIQIDLEAGVRRLQTSATVTVEEIFGQDPQGTDYAALGTIPDANGLQNANANDNICTYIPEAVEPLDKIYPAVNVCTTITATMLNSNSPEHELMEQHCDDLKADDDFQSAEWDCEVIKDFSGLHINSELFNEFGERNTWSITPSSPYIDINYGFQALERRGKPTELARSPNDPRQGILAISGQVSVTPGAIADQFQVHAINDVYGKDMTVDGSATPVNFRVACDNDSEQWITSLRFWAADNGIKFGQFLAINMPLSNGINVEIRSGNTVRTYLAEVIRVTEDFQAHFSSPINLFSIHVQAGRDLIVAEVNIQNPFVLEPCGTHAENDYIQVTISDNLTSILDLEFLVFGFYQEP